MTQDQEAKRVRLLASALAAHLEALEAHCSVRTGKVGQAHADEGVELRRAGKILIAQAREVLLCEVV